MTDHSKQPPRHNFDVANLDQAAETATPSFTGTRPRVTPGVLGEATEKALKPGERQGEGQCDYRKRGFPTIRRHRADDYGAKRTR
jgi:hypothetical protein